MQKFTLLQEETSFFNENGNLMKTKSDFENSNIEDVHLAIDTGDRKDCAIIILDKDFNFSEVFLTTSNSTKEELKEYFDENKSFVVENISEFIENIID